MPKLTDASSSRKWRWMAPLGLTAVGLGLSLTGEAIILKMQVAPAWQWVLLGTLGLVAVNAGLSIFGDAVKRRMWAEWEEQEKDEPASSAP
jgi:hypothetical protein